MDKKRIGPVNKIAEIAAIAPRDEVYYVVASEDRTTEEQFLRSLQGILDDDAAVTVFVIDMIAGVKSIGDVQDASARRFAMAFLGCIPLSSCEAPKDMEHMVTFAKTMRDMAPPA
jgi:hypothetical protein